VNALANSVPSTTQKPIAELARKTALKMTAPASGVTTTSSTRAGVQSRSAATRATVSTTKPVATRPSRRSEKSLVTSWPSGDSGRSRKASKVPVRT
jgi:hypothetical protein